MSDQPRRIVSRARLAAEQEAQTKQDVRIVDQPVQEFVVAEEQPTPVPFRVRRLGEAQAADGPPQLASPMSGAEWNALPRWTQIGSAILAVLVIGGCAWAAIAAFSGIAAPGTTAGAQPTAQVAAPSQAEIEQSGASVAARVEPATNVAVVKWAPSSTADNAPFPDAAESIVWDGVCNGWISFMNTDSTALRWTTYATSGLATTAIDQLVATKRLTDYAGTQGCPRGGAPAPTAAPNTVPVQRAVEQRADAGVSPAVSAQQRLFAQAAVVAQAEPTATAVPTAVPYTADDYAPLSEEEYNLLPNEDERAQMNAQPAPAPREMAAQEASQPVCGGSPLCTVQSLGRVPNKGEVEQLAREAETHGDYVEAARLRAYLDLKPIGRAQ